jgi:hypothetical protein
LRVSLIRQQGCSNRNPKSLSAFTICKLYEFVATTLLDWTSSIICNCKTRCLFPRGSGQGQAWLDRGASSSPFCCGFPYNARRQCRLTQRTTVVVTATGGRRRCHGSQTAAVSETVPSRRPPPPMMITVVSHDGSNYYPLPLLPPTTPVARVVPRGQHDSSTTITTTSTSTRAATTK